MRPMRPDPRGKRGWRSAGNPSGLRNERAGGGLAGCRARMRGNDHEAQRRYQGGWPLFRRVRTERASVLRAVLDEEVRHTTRRTSPPSGGRATRTSRTTTASSPVPAPSSSSATHARPVRFPLAAHQRLSANKRIPLWCPVRRRTARGVGEPTRAYSNWSSGSGVWPPSRRNSRRAASTSA